MSSLKFFSVLFFMLLQIQANADEQKKFVELNVEQVNSMRESLVKGVGENVDLSTFKAVCSPVGMSIKKINKQQGFVIRQASHKYRNPQNKADTIEQAAISRFENDKSLNDFWLDKGQSRHYFRKILVRQECLACHGAKDSRPQFIQEKFPQDKAYGFKLDDIRGVYHVVLGRR